MCSLESDKEGQKIDTEVLLKKIKEGAKDHASIDFTGGEPTEHPAILSLVKEAKKQGYRKITVSTNGRNFSDEEFAVRMADAGLAGAAVALHGEKEVHDRITQKNGAFEEALKGVENLQKKGVGVFVISVVMKNNMESLPLLLKNITTLKIDGVGLQELVFTGRATEKEVTEIAADFKQKKVFFLNNLPFISEKFPLVSIINFPRCLLPIHLPDNVLHITKHEKKTAWDFGGLNKNFLSQGHKKTAACAKCAFSDRCFGLNQKELEVFGKQSAEEMIKMDDFLEKNFF